MPEGREGGKAIIIIIITQKNSKKREEARSTHQLNTFMDEEPGIASDHGVDDARVALFVPNVVLPFGQRNGDRVWCERRYG